MAEAEASPLLPDDIGVPVQSFADILDNLDKRVREGNIEEFTPISTGFAELDMSIGGGFRPGQPVLLSGPAGVGQTSFTMQLARNIASAVGRGHTLAFVRVFRLELLVWAHRHIPPENHSRRQGANAWTTCDGGRRRSSTRYTRAALPTAMVTVSAT